LREATDHLIQQYQVETGMPSNYPVLREVEKQKALKFKERDLSVDEDADPLTKDTSGVIKLLKEIQHAGSERAAQRFIISNCQQASDILGLRQLFLWSGWKKDALTIDFVPLFETVDDLTRAAD